MQARVTSIRKVEVPVAAKGDDPRSVAVNRPHVVQRLALVEIALPDDAVVELGQVVDLVFADAQPATSVTTKEPPPAAA